MYGSFSALQYRCITRSSDSILLSLLLLLLLLFVRDAKKRKYHSPDTYDVMNFVLKRENQLRHRVARSGKIIQDDFPLCRGGLSFLEWLKSLYYHCIEFRN